MNRHIMWVVAAGIALLCFAPTRGLADTKQLSPERLDALDQAGFFTPAFKQAVHDLVNNRRALETATAERDKLNAEIPDMQQQATEIEAKAVALRQELAKYEHPEETDFLALQKLIDNLDAKSEEQVALAQAYVWTYPSSPHESEAQMYLQQLQKKITDEQKAKKEAEAARIAAQAKLVQRAQAHDLNLGEWRDFLRDMSQEELVKTLGRPASQSGDYWTYSGEWIVEPASKSKSGMMINFYAGRVYNVVEAPHLH